MKATEVNFLKFLQGQNQFRIPIYQRTYSWTVDQCRQLWTDIIAVAQDVEAPAHFVGSIVYIERGLYQVADVPQLLVIDGQQRLATLSLLLAALSRALLDGALPDVTPQRITHYYLVNPEETGELRYKLVLTQSDEGTLKALVDGRPLPAQVSGHLLANYEFFKSQLSQANLTQLGIDLATVYNGIRKLIVVQIVLDREHDDPQRIFESLNSTGLKLSQADLIRNYVLMDLDPHTQETLYMQYWYRMEQQFGQTEPEGAFDRFVRDYLTLHSPTGAIPRLGDVYTSFKSYVRTLGLSMREVVADVYRFAQYYISMAVAQDADPALHELFAAIKALRVDVAYPFLLLVYDDYVENRLAHSDFVAILRLIESYVFRRGIVGIATNSLNKTFATLGQYIVPDAYVESIQGRLLGLTGSQRFPTDEEFHTYLVIKDVYNFRNTLYLLGRLETHGRKETANLAGATIEHIMPQNPNLSAAWRTELGRDWQSVQGKYLHTLGNLTLTGYNSEYGDRPFAQKRDMPGGYAESAFRLTRDVAKCEQWTAEAIAVRAALLADQATHIWERPSLPAPLIARYRRRDTHTPPASTAGPPPGMDAPTPRGAKLRRFWQQLLARASTAGLQTHAGRAATTDYWLSGSAGRSGLTLQYIIKQGQTVVQLGVQSSDLLTNKRLFDQLYAQRAEIEAAFGGNLVWRRMDDKKTSQINYTVSQTGLDAPESEWPQLQDDMIAAMRRLHAALADPIRALT